MSPRTRAAIRLYRISTAAFALLAIAAGLTLPAAGRSARAAEPQSSGPQRIGIIGTGHIGGTLAKLWAHAGYELMISSDHPAKLEALARSLGPRVHVGTPRDAARFSEVVLISVPYGVLPEVGRSLAHDLAGKIVLDTGNPYPQRDGAMALEARRLGTGVASARYLPGVRLVRAFNAISWVALGKDAHRAGERFAIPLAGDDPEALAVAERLVRAAGFEPVVVGGLARAKEFDVGTPVYVKLLTARQLRAALHLPAG
ncbi:MAG TPA: NAD(P)-binding domain-containing protein [Steroidobacteraceae bacterium]|nr:NAD(P)-binding domain-containing protein [Steroidobacteraceae bacterium]